MNPLVVTFLNESYIPIGLNWWAAISSLDLQAEVLVVTLDVATREALSEYGIPVLHRPLMRHQPGDLWIHRIGVLRELLSKGYDVVHSDADAVWLGNPLPQFRSCGTDMVFSQGTVWPYPVHSKHGIVLCCGLFSVRNSNYTRAFFEQVEREIVVDRDDQTTINRLVDNMIDRWIVHEPYSVGFRDNTFTASRSPIVGNSVGRPSVSIVPYHTVPRLICDSQSLDGVLVAHPLCGKSIGDKIVTLKRYGLYQQVKTTRIPGACSQDGIQHCERIDP